MIQSVSHAIDVLEELSKAGGEVGVTELSKRLKLHKNNVFRLLATLELRGYVEQNLETEDYRLGVKSLQLGQAYLAQSDLVQRSLPIMRKLAETTGETVSLAVLQNGQVQFPISIASKRPVRVSARINTSMPAKNNAAGRLLTAQLPDAMLEELLAANTPQDAAIKNSLNELRGSGLITDKAAIEPDVASVAKIITGHNDQVIGAIEILSPQYRAKLDNMTTDVQEAAAELSATLGAVKPGLIATIEKEITTTTTAAM